jgi:hypothetical protein
MLYSLFRDIGAKITNIGSYYWTNTQNQSPYKNMKIDTSNKFNEDSKIRVGSINAVNSKVDFFNKDYKSVKGLITSYYLYYPTDFYIKYPEFVIYSLGLEEKILTGLPNIENRKREHVRNWMFHSKLTLDQFKEVGF